MFEVITTSRSINVSNVTKKKNSSFFWILVILISLKDFVYVLLLLCQCGHTFLVVFLHCFSFHGWKPKLILVFFSLPLSLAVCFFIYLKQNIILQNENQALKKNISALIKTARVEINRKDEEISHLHQRYKQRVELKTCLWSDHVCILARNFCVQFKKN